MKKILVIDDDGPLRISLAMALRRNGYEVLEASHGTAGLELALAHRPDLVLTDVNMPGQNGLDVLKELHARAETAAIPVVLMTGEPHKADARHSMDLGADDYLLKPFAIEQMLATLSARLERQDGIQRAMEAQTRAERLSTAEKIRLQISALDAAASGIVITDHTGTILWVNPAFTHLTGYSAEEAVGQNPRILRSDHHPRPFYTGLWATINAGNTWHGEIVNRRKDGICYEEEMTITPVRGEHGRIQNFIAIKQDVSGRKLSENILRESEARFRSLFENMPEGLACCQILFAGNVPVDFVYREVNPAFEKLTGLKDVCGRKVSALYPGIHQTNPELLEIYGRVALTGRSERFESCLGGLGVWFSVSVYSQQVGHFVAVFDNITARKQTEQALAHERDLLQALMDNLPDHIYFKDANSRFTRINQAHASHLGLNHPEEAVGKSDADFFLLREARQKLVDERRLLATGEPILGLVEKSDTAGKNAWVSTTKVPLYGPNREITGLVGISRNITKIKQAEEDLQRKTALLEAQIDSSIDGILVVDEQGRKVLQNQRLTELFKVPPSIAEDPDDSKLLAWVTEATRHPEEFLKKVCSLYGQPDQTSRDEIELKDGRFLDRYSAPMLGHDGQCYGRIWTFRDITDRKRMEVRLRQSEEKFRGFVENFRDAIMTLDTAGGKFISGNPAAVKMFGAKSEEEILGLTPADLSPERQPDGKLSREVVAQRLLAQGWQHFEWTHRRLTGEEFFADVLLTCMQQGGKSVILSSVRDITGRKLAEAKLRESEAKFSQLAESMPQIVWITRPDGWNIYFNQQWMDYTGLTSEQSHGHGWLTPFHPQDQQRASDAWQLSTATGGTYSLECRLRRADGIYRWWLIRGVPVRDAAGVIEKWFGTYTDIDDMKQAELQRQMMELQLRQSQKLESIGQLAAGIAHEINTPTQYVGDNTRFVKESFASVARVLDSHEALLAAAKAGAVSPELILRSEEILAASDLDYLRAQIPQALTETLEGIGRVTKIVSAMKEFSHPGGREKAPVDLNKAIQSTVTVARNEWKYVAELNLDLDPALPIVPCFLGEINQVVLNLVVNAAHTIADVIKINPGKKGLIALQTRRDGDFVQIRVADTGTGISDANRTKIFEPFFTTKDIGHGTGQGLAMVYGTVVNRHGGTVTFETEVGRGTTFIVRLPLNPSPTKAAPPLAGSLPKEPAISTQ